MFIQMGSDLVKIGLTHNLPPPLLFQSEICYCFNSSLSEGFKNKFKSKVLYQIPEGEGGGSAKNRTLIAIFCLYLNCRFCILFI